MLNRNPDRLFRRFRDRGDLEALARVFDLVAPKLYQVAQHLVRDAGETEDLVQSAFLAVIEDPRRWDGERPLVPWLLGILANQAGALRRRTSRSPELERLPTRESGDPGEELERIELTRAVHAVLLNLPPKYRAVLSPYLVDGKRPREIASELGRPVGTVRVQLHRGLARMRAALPAGFAAATALTVLSDRALASLRARVLERATEIAGALTTSSGSSVMLGGIVMSKKVALGTLGLVLAVGLSSVWIVASDPPPEVPAAVASSVDPVDRAVTREELGSPDPEEPKSETSPVRTALPAQPDRTAPTSGLVVVGRVVDVIVGDPVPGTVVKLLYGGASSGGWAWVEARPGADGRFEFAPLDETPRGISVEAPGYAPYRHFPWQHDDFHAALAAHRAFDLGLLEIERGARVAGRVVRENGEPVSGRMPVFLSRYHYSLAREDVGGFAHEVERTNRDGTFRLADRIPFGGTWDYDNLLFVGDEDGLGWARLRSLEGSGDHEGVEIVIGGHGELVVEVYDGRGDPEEGVGVELVPAFAPLDHLAPLDEAGGEQSRRWVGDTRGLRDLLSRETDDEGRAAFRALPFGRDTADERHRRYVVHVRTAGTVVREVDLDPLRPLTVRIDLVPGYAIAGRVLDEDGRSIEGARVSGGGAPGVLADERGSFELENVRPVEGVVSVRATAPGFVPEERVLEPRKGRPVEVDLHLARAEPITGRVVDQHGDPVLDAGLHAMRLFEEVEQEGALPEQRHTRTDAEGRFAFEDVRAGRWQLSAFPPHGDGAFLGVTRLAVVSGDEDVELVLTRGKVGRTRVVAAVRDALTGELLDAAQATVYGRGDHGTDFALSERPARRRGEVVVERMRVGAWRLWVRVAGRDASHVDFEVRENDRKVELTVLVGARGGLDGTVELSEGLEHARVHLVLVGAHDVPRGSGWGEIGTTRATLEPAEDGSFSVDDLHPGRYEVRLQHYSHFAFETVDVGPGERTPLVLRALPGVRVELAGLTPPEREGWATFRFEHEDGWDSGTLYGQIEGGNFTASTIVPPGPLRWSAEIPLVGAAGNEPTEVASGSVRVALGPAVAIPVSWVIAE